MKRTVMHELGHAVLSDSSIVDHQGASAEWKEEQVAVLLEGRRQCEKVVPPAGLEPATLALGMRCSIQMSYGGTCVLHL